MTEERTGYSIIRVEDISMPAMTVQAAVDRHRQMVSFVKEIMVDGKDFGTIPGTGDKPTLLKPGAEKLTTFFGLTKRFLVLEKVEDWTGKDHDGEPFFYYWYRCQLLRGDTLIAEGDGSCNSMESKYRWRWQDITKPNDEAIDQQKAAGVGRFKKRKGQWVWQARHLNHDIASQVNTIQKMAVKRALVAATLLAVNASEFFTQDLEDLVTDPPISEEARPARQAPKKSGNSWPARPWDAMTLKRALTQKVGEYMGKAGPPSEKQLDYARSSLGQLGLNDSERHTLALFLFGVESTGDLSAAQCSALIDWIGSRPPEYKASQDAKAEALTIVGR